jgi:hypothetical protein
MGVARVIIIIIIINYHNLFHLLYRVFQVSSLIIIHACAYDPNIPLFAVLGRTSLLTDNTLSLCSWCAPFEPQPEHQLLLSWPSFIVVCQAITVCASRVLLDALILFPKLYWGLFLQVNRPELDNTYSSSYNLEFKTARSYTSVPLCPRAIALN